jgi:hypothetical protein
MDATVGTFRRRRNLFAALGAFVLVMVALGGVLLVTSSGAETAAKPKVRAAATSPATEPSTTTTSTTAVPFVAPPAASPTGSTAGTSSAPAAPPVQEAAPAPPAGFVLTCISPDEVPDEVDTSSRTDTWVPEGTPIPAGCYRS